MAGTGIGIFLPSESAYKDPNRFKDVLMAEGNKEATYLAQMDQFFAQLDETKREFDVTTTQRSSEFERTLALNRDTLTANVEKSNLDREFEYDRLSNTTELDYAQLDVNRESIIAQKEIAKSTASKAQNKLDIVRSNNAFYQSLYEKEETQKQQTHDVAKNLLTNGGIFGTSGTTGIRSTEANSSRPSVDDWGNSYDLSNWE